MGYQTYHDALDEAQAEAEGVCEHSWLEHLDVSTGKVNMRVCSVCGATADPRPLPFDDSLEKNLAEPMKIALDYDGTFTRDPGFWRGVALAAMDQGHDIRIVTARDITHDNIDDRVPGIPVIYCNGVAKRFYCHHFAHFDPHVWIDDKPEAVDGNSNFNRDMLAKWRAERDH